jgi:hypothetical protein
VLPAQAKALQAHVVLLQKPELGQREQQASGLELGQVLMVPLYLTMQPTALAAMVVSLRAGGHGHFPDLGDHADNKALLLNVVRFYCIRILKDLACYSRLAAMASVHHMARCWQASVPE